MWYYIKCEREGREEEIRSYARYSFLEKTKFCIRREWYFHDRWGRKMIGGLEREN
uniref:Uncharacterized protein n=1 Tax=Arundo donax TaxID=35708 RepID=A0A0A9EKQ4_ARUDO